MSHFTYISAVLKNLLVISFILLLMQPMFSRLWVLMDFQWRQDYIAVVLCENRDKPDLECNGKCYLAKQLRGVDMTDDSPKPKSRIQEIQEHIFFFYSPIYTLSLTSILPQRVVIDTRARLGTSSDYLDRLWRPPRFV